MARKIGRITRVLTTQLVEEWLVEGPIFLISNDAELWADFREWLEQRRSAATSPAQARAVAAALRRDAFFDELRTTGRPVAI